MMEIFILIEFLELEEHGFRFSDVRFDGEILYITLSDVIFEFLLHFDLTS